MYKDFSFSIDQLAEAFKNGLPGADAQYKMAPAGRRARSAASLKNEDHRLAAVLILLFERDGELSFPLIQRPTYQGIHSAQMSLPGGKLEDNDGNDLSVTALRETHEEVGISPNDITLLGQLTELYIPPSKFLVSPFVGVCKKEPSFNWDNPEVDELVEVETSQLRSPKNKGETQITISKGMRITTPYYHLSEKVVWGATAMILSEFEHMLKRV